MTGHQHAPAWLPVPARDKAIWVEGVKRAWFLGCGECGLEWDETQGFSGVDETIFADDD